MAVSEFASCEKEEDKEPIEAPIPTSPENGVEIDTSSLDEKQIRFKWAEAQSKARYKLFFSTDQQIWGQVAYVTANNLFLIK